MNFRLLNWWNWVEIYRNEWIYRFSLIKLFKPKIDVSLSYILLIELIKELNLMVGIEYQYVNITYISFHESMSKAIVISTNIIYLKLNNEELTIFISIVIKMPNYKCLHLGIHIKDLQFIKWNAITPFMRKSKEIL